MSTLIAPLSGEVIEANEALEGSETTINDDPYGEGWLIKVRLSDPSELDALMDSDAYSAFVDAAVSFTSLTDRDLATRCSRRSASARWTSCSPTSPRRCASTGRWTSARR